MARRRVEIPIEPDPRSIPELIAGLKALGDLDDDDHFMEYRDLYDALRTKPQDEVFIAASGLCRSSQANARAIGARIVPEKHPETFNLLAECLKSEQDVEALVEIIFKLGNNHDERAVELLMSFKRHPDVDVRYAVTYALQRYDDPTAIQTLIELSVDEDVDIRDWATFGLGTMTRVDTPALRDALLARLDDADFVTRSEAFVGLAYRKDARIIDPLLREMSEGASDKLCEALYELVELVDPQHPLLAPAIDRCKRNDGWPDYKEITEE